MSPSSTAKKKTRGASKKGASKKSSAKKKTAAKKPAAGGKGVKKPKSTGKRGKLEKEVLTAETADKYLLYQAAVQSPDADVDFLIDV